MEPFTPGAGIVVRNVIFGKPFDAFPNTVVADDGYELVTAMLPGAEGAAMALWIDSIRNKNAASREQMMPALANRDWKLGPWTWRRTKVLSVLYPDRYYGVKPMWQDETFLGWYVDFQAPYGRTAIGVDTSDLHIDLVVEPDFSHRWKDEDEYTHARRLGLITDRCHSRLDDARSEVLSLVENRQGPFADGWEKWQPDPGEPLPAMPAETLSVPTAPHLQGLPE